MGPNLGVRTLSWGRKIKVEDCEFTEVESRKKTISATLNYIYLSVLFAHKLPGSFTPESP